MSTKLIEEYNSILSTYANQIQEINERAHEELKERRVLYGGKIMRTFLRPSLLTGAQFAALENACNVLIRSVNTILDKVYGGDTRKMGSSLGIPEEELEFTLLDPGYSLQVAINRMDAFVDGDALTFLEFNCDSPGGIAYSDGLCDVMSHTPFFQDFAKRHKVHCPSGRESLLAAFQRIYKEWGGKDTMSIAIVDWKGIATSSEFEMFRDFFQANGLKCVIVDPREAQYDGKTLTFEGVPVNFVYKRVITGELLAKRNEVKPFLEAYRGRAACFANSFRSRLADNKLIFAPLSDPELADRFSPEERAVAAATIPWTRKVAECRTSVDGHLVDLVEHLRKNREAFVIKPNTDYGGRNVTIGSETSQADWEATLSKAITGDWVVQKRVTIPEETFPVVTPEGLTFESRKVNINPFALGGSYGGCVSRLSTQSIINVSAGGGLIPLFVVED